MPNSCSDRRIPLARVDPIDTQFVALSMIVPMLADPLIPETVAILLDHEQRGQTILTVYDTVDDDEVYGVIDKVAASAARHDECGGLLLTTVRPGRSTNLDDAERWVEISIQCDEMGLELVEWFVVGCDTSCPRELVGEHPRWAA